MFSALLSVLQKFEQLEVRVSRLEKSANPSVANKTTETAKQVSRSQADDDGGDVDLFGSDSEEESTEAAKIREERLTAYNAKKAKSNFHHLIRNIFNGLISEPVVIAKSSIILDVKPWDDETDMAKMEENVRKIATDGLLWGAAKLVPLAYGIRKLQITCVVEDDKVSVDWLQEQIEALEDFVHAFPGIVKFVCSINFVFRFKVWTLRRSIKYKGDSENNLYKVYFSQWYTSYILNKYHNFLFHRVFLFDCSLTDKRK